MQLKHIALAVIVAMSISFTVAYAGPVDPAFGNYCERSNQTNNVQHMDHFLCSVWPYDELTHNVSESQNDITSLKQKVLWLDKRIDLLNQTGTTSSSSPSMIMPDTEKSPKLIDIEINHISEQYRELITMKMVIQSFHDGDSTQISMTEPNSNSFVSKFTISHEHGYKIYEFETGFAKGMSGEVKIRLSGEINEMYTVNVP